MSTDTFSDIWKRVFEELEFKRMSNNELDDDNDKPVRRLLKEYLGSYSDYVTPDVVRRVLHLLGQERLVVIALDEFDTIGSYDTRAMMSNTLKFLSDRAVPATVVLIGVSDDVESLIAEHRSLERCLKQIYMPRMSQLEMEMIVAKGLQQVGMRIETRGLDEITRISRGLPHYAHLLGLLSGRAACDSRSLEITEPHVRSAVEAAIGEAQASIQGDYSKAVMSSRKEAIYKEVILACALTETNDWGWFYPRDVREPLERILKRPSKIETFSRHLHAFCGPEHGTILIKDDRSGRPRYRFENPLMEPYVLIRGITQRLISIEDLLKPKPDGFLF